MCEHVVSSIHVFTCIIARFIVSDGNPMDNIVTLYATLFQGLSPVLDAEVYADVEKGSFSHTVHFADNGIGTV